MKKYFKLFLIIFTVFISSSCNGQDCKALKSNFDTYESALKIIKSSEFKISENCDTNESSWINHAEYFSCDKKTGFLLIKTKLKTYIHKKVPIGKWNEFKRTKSFGNYYNRNIKNRFQLIL